MEISTGRRVFYPTQGEPAPAICPLCQFTVTLQNAQTGQATADWQPFDDALAEWHDGGRGEVHCPNCGSAIPMTNGTGAATGRSLGSLGFTFWNWPRLNPAFVERPAARLGHRVVVTRGRV